MVLQPQTAIVCLALNKICAMKGCQQQHVQQAHLEHVSINQTATTSLLHVHQAHVAYTLRHQGTVIYLSLHCCAHPACMHPAGLLLSWPALKRQQSVHLCAQTRVPEAAQHSSC